MRIKLGVLLLLAVIVVASAGMGISYADGGIELGQAPSCYCDVAFTSAEPGDPPDNEFDKDVGHMTVTRDPSGSSITVDITTAYPGYEAYVNFTITNTGCKPIYLYGVNVNYDNAPSEEALDVSLIGLPTVLPALLCQGDGWDGTVTVKVTQNAEQNTVYGFTIEMNFEGCCPDPEILNGGFEKPLVGTSQEWDIFDSGTSGLGWTVEWYDGKTKYQDWDRPSPAHLELHTEDAVGFTPDEGSQYAELDTDWDGPGGGLNGEPASVAIYQDINTCSWRKYTVSYSWSPRAGTDCSLEIYWGDDLISTHTGNTRGWHSASFTRYGLEGTTRLKFVETGEPDSFGMFLDNVDVQLKEECIL